MLTKRNIISNKRGFTMMEMIVVLAIVTMSLSGIASLMVQTMQAQNMISGYLKASMLAQEGIEIVRGYRDDNWLNQAATSWDDNFGVGDTDGSYVLDYRPNSINDGPDNISDPACVLRINPAGYYEHTTGSPTNLRRIINVTLGCGGDCYDVESKVNWVVSGRTHTYITRTKLYDWR